MAVDTNFASLFKNLKIDDPWVAPKTWESIPSESGACSFTDAASFSSSNQSLYDVSTISEASLVRLAMNAMQGVQSALTNIEKLSAAFCSDPADRTIYRIPSLWNRASSTYALGNILKSIGSMGSLVFLLREFVDHFTNLNLDESLMVKRHDNSDRDESQSHHHNEVRLEEQPLYSLVNQAFSVAVGKVLEGYMSALDTIHASIFFRHPAKDVDLTLHASLSGCLKSVLHPEITLLELHLHAKELRTQIEALGNICNLHNVAPCFSACSFDDLIRKAKFEFHKFYRGGDLLTYLYTQLQVAEPAHHAVLKFLFLRSCEPYCGFIRSWIFKAEIDDPYKEFFVESIGCLQPYPHGKAGFSVHSSLASIREQDGVSIPSFLKDFVVPLVRAGQQLQVLMKLLELYIHIPTIYNNCDDFLPCWRSFSSSSLSYSSPLTFNKSTIQAMVLARECYYQKMNEKLDSILAILEVRNQQVAPHVSVPFFFEEGGGCSNTPVSYMLEDDLIRSPTTDKRSSNVGIGSMGSDDSSTIDEFSYVEDICDSSECSFSNSSEEKVECEKQIMLPDQMNGQQRYFSALSFSHNTPIINSFQNPGQLEMSCHVDSDLCEIFDRSDFIGHFVKCHHEEMIYSHVNVPLESRKPNCSCVSNTPDADSLPGNDWSIGHLLKDYLNLDGKYKDEPGLNPLQYGPQANGRQLGVLREVIPYVNNIIYGNNTLKGKVLCEDQSENGIFAYSNLYKLQGKKVDNHCNFHGVNPLSVNPMLTRNASLHLMGVTGENSHTDNGKPLPYFDFSSVDDPYKVCMDKIPNGLRHEHGSSFPSFLKSSASVTGCKINNHGERHGEEEVGIKKVSSVNLHLDLKDHKLEDMLTITSGGSSWEKLLGCSRKPLNNAVTQSSCLSTMFEIPVDIIIDKCLLQEIVLQYKYVSRLTIKFLEEGFDLQEHLMALRRYHFMEVADWADLFILSLWHHKWCVTEADQRLSEVQALLELSVQRSSCEQDHNKHRLFVYMKGHGAMPLAASVIGVRSFDFLGLGYRVDWPLSIILTPDALKIYAEIFSFLIQVKLAIFSLTDIWCSLKALVHLINKNHDSELHQREVGHLNTLMKMRHQVNHFVCTLQQYVESQLSHVSWCKFLHSLQNKVKDMMDLESVHMEYLTNSLHICFLSDETRPVASIIESILQCALDFRSCLTEGVWDTEMDQQNSLSRFSRVNISQVNSIKQKFDKNLKELHLCYLKTPKHKKFGLSCFWGYLNYNEYYSDVGNEMRYPGF